MPIALEEKIARPSVMSTDKLRRFVSAYWLRPENAFWMVLRSHVLSSVPIRSPFIDLSCGDGIFSFLHAGGRFAPEFDVFADLSNVAQRDIRMGDLFDSCSEFYQPEIVTRPDYRIDCGTDFKKSLIAKAGCLDFYSRLMEQDHNRALPFADHTFETVYCNAAYWIHEIDAFLSELGRISVSGGTIVLHVKLDAIKRFTLRNRSLRLGDRWLDIINRGRFESWPSLCDRTKWEDRFERAHLEILSAEPFVTGTHAHIWDIGLRPIAPLLIRAMNSLHDHLRSELKHDWVNLFCELLDPFCDPDLDFLTDGEPVEMQYVLTPRK